MLNLFWFMIYIMVVNGSVRVYHFRKEGNNLGKDRTAQGIIRCATVCSQLQHCMFYIDQYTNQCSTNLTKSMTVENIWCNTACKKTYTEPTTIHPSKSNRTENFLMLAEVQALKANFYKFKNASLETLPVYTAHNITSMIYVFRTKTLLVAEQNPYRVTAQDNNGRSIVMKKINCKQFVKDERASYIAIKGRRYPNANKDSIIAFNINFQNPRQVYKTKYNSGIQSIAINPTFRVLYVLDKRRLFNISYFGGNVKTQCKKFIATRICYNTVLNSLFLISRHFLYMMLNDCDVDMVSNFKVQYEKPIDMLCFDKDVYISFKRCITMVAREKTSNVSKMGCAETSKFGFKMTIAQT